MYWKIKAYVKLFRIKQSTESNHENKTSKDVVPLPSCVHPKRMWVAWMINRDRKSYGFKFWFRSWSGKKGIVGEAAKKDTRLQAIDDGL